MKIFSAPQIRACDAYTIKASNIRSAELMERASLKCAGWIKDNYHKDNLFVVLCGTGNNGGDGLAITRILHQRGYGVKAFLLNFGKELTADCMANFQKLQALDKDLVSVVQPDTFITDIQPHIIIIDAILGTGLSRPTEGWVAAFINQINQLPNKKISIDIPSGLPADIVPDDDAAIIKAEHTLSFQFYKRTFLHPESGTYTGKLHILDIALDQTFINATHTQYKTIDAEDVAAIYKKRNPFSHKGTYGSVLMIGGSYGKIGAITLSTKAALRAGAGLVTALLPSCGYTAIQTAVPEAMCRTSGKNMLEKIEGWEKVTAIGIGPGMGIDPDTATAFAEFIDACKEPIVVDADALNLMSRQHDLLAKLPNGSILTPHPKEFARLFGENTNTMIQVDHARIQAMRFNINIVLKGRHTVIITQEGDCYYNMTGNAGMATGGSGDVLTGVITGLLAQGYAPHEAAILGVYLHGLAGDIAARELSQEALIAGDIINYLGKAFLTIRDTS
ncbi:MAG: NAD(P)H-hydrate dehydratase [Flavipsychrobacter sp.]|jgi:NAD(P)H-hydrate epimerase|nr:NAD(P)H-hydrate dehydratase [Flavipsychrobacter sp.]